MEHSIDPVWRVEATEFTEDRQIFTLELRTIGGHTKTLTLAANGLASLIVALQRAEEIASLIDPTSPLAGERRMIRSEQVHHVDFGRQPVGDHVMALMRIFYRGGELHQTFAFDQTLALETGKALIERSTGERPRAS